MLGEHCHLLLGNDSSVQLRCLIEGEAAAFLVTVEGNAEISHLKEIVYTIGIHDAKHSMVANELVLLKVDINLDAHNEHSLKQLSINKNDEGAQELTDLKPVSYFWQGPPANDRLHVFVKLPATVRARFPASPQHPSIRPHTDSKSLHAPPAKIQLERRIKAPLYQMEIIMTDAFEGYEKYMEYLTQGKLDGYLDSIRREDKVTDLEVELPLEPILLLHDLGKHTDQERINELFIDDTVHLFGVSGAGKTRLSLDGLCHNWGFYISCRSGRGPACGSDDFTVATEILTSMSTTDISTNADRVFAMLLCARIFIFRRFMQQIPSSAGVTTARRRWVLAQVLPPRLNHEDDDLFVKVLRSLRHADTEIMLKMARGTLREITAKRRDFFPAGATETLRLFVVIDEAQVAADHLSAYFRPTTGTDLRPVLREMYRLFQVSGIFVGIILAGTGLSMKIASLSEKRVEPRVFTDFGYFTKDKPSQIAYIRRYLTLSDNNISDQRLLERMTYWFSGRHRLTASLVELFLSEDVPPHRVLTAFVKHLSGFTITDAIDLEDGERPISLDLSSKIERYGQLTAVDHLSKEQNREELKQCLVEALLRWTIGSQPTSIPIERDMHEMIAFGVGHLGKMASTQIFDPDVNYPVYIFEPLVVLSLSSLFNEQSWTTRQTWIAKSLGTAPNNSSLFEDAMVLVLMEIWGGKFNALADGFRCSQSLGSRRVTLVSLKHRVDGTMQSSPVSWLAGSSDRFSLKAKSPTDILAFLENPDGKVFLLPDIHMGPDLLCFLQDEETEELILLALQANISPSLVVQHWQSAVDSITPQFFYMVVNGGRRGQYSPASYPGLSKDVVETLEMMLGPEEYLPVAEAYRSKLRRTTTSASIEEQLATQPSRQTPKYLHIDATSADDKQREDEWKGDVAVLRWDVVKSIWVRP